ncbi:MAG: hypothetical protein GXX00_08100 [Hungateiclostridium thermocellum]|nr:hypothetical protein [Acetivibrio thermocellus]
MNVAELKREYNKLLKRYNAGSAYMDDNTIPLSEREARIPDFQRIVKKLDTILYLFKQNGVSYTDDEVLHGFTEVIE